MIHLVKTVDNQDNQPETSTDHQESRSPNSKLGFQETLTENQESPKTVEKINDSTLGRKENSPNQLQLQVNQKTPKSYQNPKISRANGDQNRGSDTM